MKTVTETTLDVQTKKVYKNGKWMEETTRTKSLTNEKGTTVESKKTTFRDLVASELPNNHAKERSLASPESPTDIKPPTPLGTVIAPKKPAKTVPARRVQPPALKDNQDSFGRQVLVATNSYRKIHGAPPLKLSDRLNKLAKDWAEKLAKMERMEHGDKKNIGENIYCKTSSQPWFEMSGGEVVENWYNEVEDHNYNEEPSQGFLKTGHFTQLVWKDTKEMGVAFARNKNGHMAFVVAYFSPKGNWIGDFKSQVLPPGGVTKTSQNKTSNKGNTDTTKPTITVISPDSSTGRKSITSTAKFDTTKNKTGSPTSSKTSYQSRTTPDSPSKKSRSTLGSVTSYQSRNKVGSPTSSFSSKTKTPSIQSRSNLASSVSNKSNTSTGTPRSTTVTPSNKSRTSVDSPSIYNSRNSISTPTSIKSKDLISTSSDSPTRKPFSSPSKSITSATSVTSAISMVDQKFYDDFLKAHNFYRSKHGVEPLKLEDELSKYAQEWADKIAKKDMMEHRSDSEFGENIYMKWSPNPNYKIPGEEAVDSWYEEIADYDFGKEPLDLSAGHFTQVIWADTEELGVGVAKSESGKIYVVANYDPPGNYIGQFSKMVPPPI